MRIQTIEQKIKLIKEAVYEHAAVVLCTYFSAKSRTVQDRKVIPVKIKGECVLCIDIDKDDWRMFRFDQINGNVYWV